MNKFDIAFSYASEQKEIIKQYSDKLEELGLKVFIDIEHPELFVFKHVPDILKEIYADEETVMLIFLSHDYTKKDFTKYESHIAFERLLTEKRLAIIKLDDSVLSWVPASFFYYDINKYSFNEICQSLCTAIKGYKIPDIEILFKNIDSFLLSNCQKLNSYFHSKTCIIYNIGSTDENRIKIIFSESLNRILLFSHIFSDSTFPVAEIYVREGKMILENRGFSSQFDLIKKYLNEYEFQHDLLQIINYLLEKKYD